MSYISLYRRYRPQDFKDVAGQTHVVQTLQNAVTNDRLTHAYVFAGPRGTGKTSMARILAKTLNCRKREKEQLNPCNQCDLCLGITEGTAIDVIEIDAASNRGIDEIRQLRERVNFTPAEGQYKVYIIDEVHMLTTEAFNALLKTLEEPPKHTVFILATTEPQKIPETIISRCQRLEFSRLNIDTLKERLKFIAKEELIEIDDRVISAIARNAEGGMRDAISLLDQLYSFAGQTISMDNLIAVIGTAETTALFECAEAVSAQNTAAALEIVSRFVEEGKNISQVTRDLLGHFRYLIFASLGSESVIDLTEDHINRLKHQSKNFSLEELKKIIGILSKADSQMRWYPNSRLLLEIALVELTTNKNAESGIQSPKSINSNKELSHNTVALREACTERSRSAQGDSSQLISPEPRGNTPKQTTNNQQVRAIHESPQQPANQPARPPANQQPVHPSIQPATIIIKEVSNETKMIRKGEARVIDAAVPADSPRVDQLASQGSESGDGVVELTTDNRQPTTNSLTIADIKHKWDSVLNSIKNKKFTIYTLICEGDPVSVDDNVLIIGFNPGFSFHQEKLASEENQQVLLSVLKEIYSQEFKLETVTLDKPVSSAVSGNGNKEDDINQKVLNLFGGQYVS
ncbi:MAG: DNA polymerase III subunit gamma/tau [Candidatus Margulisiibacteriota bacterium]